MAIATATIDDARLDETFAALANSTRRAILARLAEGEASVNDLAEPFDLTLPAISRHIKVLEHAGLITAAGERSSGHARSPQHHLPRWLTGPSSIATSGTTDSIAWTTTSGIFKTRNDKKEA